MSAGAPLEHPDVPATPLRWLALAAAAIAIFASYYESDVIGELADLLGRQRGFSHADIGSLNAAIYWPSVVLALVGGLLIDRFGAARCMFESNFPVDAGSLTYTMLWNAFKIYADGLAATEKDDLFFSTANRAYRLGL